MPANAIQPRDPYTVRHHLWRTSARVPAALFGFFLGVYALTSAGRLDSADGILVADTARALLLHHTLALPPDTPDAVLGVGGYAYSMYGIALTLVEIPFVAIGLLLRHLTHLEAMVDWAVAITNTFLTALGCVLFFLIIRQLGASQRRALALTLLYGLCTLAWPYAKTDFTEPLQTLCLLAAAYAGFRARAPGQERWLWICGGALGLAVLTKSALLAAVPAFAVYIASASLIGAGRSGALHQLRSSRWWSSTLRRQLALLTPVVLAGVVTLWVNALRFGSPLDNGYSRAVNGASLIGPLPWGVFAGAFGLLFSLNSGLVFYSTPVVVGMFGLRRFARRQPHEVVLIGLLTSSLLILYSTYRYWAGLAAYGPRYLVPLIPFLLLPAIDAFPGVWTQRSTQRGALALLGLVALLGMAEQLLGVLVSFGAYSALTCLTSPCPASLDASQSEILYDIWLLPTSLAYNLLGHVPAVVRASYPFGVPPLGRVNWQGGLVDRMRYFWFVFLPHPILSLVTGLVMCGSVSGRCLVLLARSTGVVAGRAPSASALGDAQIQRADFVVTSAVKRSER